MGQTGSEANPAGFVDLMRELGDLKRIHSANRDGSIATRLFKASWSYLLAGADRKALAFHVTAAALSAARLGDLDRDALRRLGVAEERTDAILLASLAEQEAMIDETIASECRNAITADTRFAGAPICPFVEVLIDQPRAGVTKPGVPRLMLQPAENHGEHSIMVAIYAVLLAPRYEADPADVFLIGLAHHLHNAAMPDSGFTGEMLLGDDLGAITETARNQALAQLPDGLARDLSALLGQIADDSTPAARAFHAADALDRTLEIEQHLRAATTRMASVIDDYELVHDGPVKHFQDGVLQQFGLLELWRDEKGQRA